MAVFEVAEHFVSINGEGQHAGQLAFFLRLKALAPINIILPIKFGLQRLCMVTLHLLLSQVYLHLHVV